MNYFIHDIHQLCQKNARLDATNARLDSPEPPSEIRTRAATSAVQDFWRRRPLTHETPSSSTRISIYQCPFDSRKILSRSCMQAHGANSSEVTDVETAMSTCSIFLQISEAFYLQFLRLAPFDNVPSIWILLALRKSDEGTQDVCLHVNNLMLCLLWNNLQ